MRPRRRARGSARDWCPNYRDVVLLLIAGFFAQGLARAQAPAPPLVLGGVPAAPLESHVGIRVTGIMAEVTVRQRFRNEGEAWLQGRYSFPLPEDAAVHAMTLTVGERRIEGEVRERGAARRNYQAARAAGQRAGLVEQDTPARFTTDVANVGPGEEVVVTLSYTELLDYRDETFHLRFPTTITPRYGERTGGPTVPAAEAALALTVDLEPGFPTAWIESPSHPVATERTATGYRVRLLGPGQEPVLDAATPRPRVRPDRTFELAWAPVLGQAPRAALLTGAFGGERYGLLMFLPPQAAHRQAAPRELIFVIDTSGSMGGEPIRQARASLVMAVASLRETDRFDVIAFDSGLARLFDGPVDATAAHVGRALAWIERLAANGGTNMAPALAAATAGTAPAGFVRQIVFVTDGAVAGERALLAQLARDLGDARLFTVGIGSAPNGWFLRKAAEFGRGSHTLIGARATVSERMDALLARLEYPLATDLRVDWPGAAESYPGRLPDLYRGEALVVAARLPAGAREAPITVGGQLEGGFWEAQIAPQDAHHGSPVATLWARRKVADLMDELVLGAEPEAVRGEVLALALAHGLVTRYTSFVAVDRTPARSAAAAGRSRAFAGAAPAGAIAFAETGARVALPATDAGTVMRVTLGLTLALLGWVLARRLRDSR